MDRISAADMLGISPSATVVEVSKAYAAIHAELVQREREAPSEALRSKYQAALADLDTALAVLQGAPVESPSPASSPSNPLSATQLGDLPLSSAQAQGNDYGFEIGSIVGGRFEIKGVLGRGGMGTVYRVHDQHGHQDIALKVLQPRFLASSGARERFMNEFHTTRKLAHPHIVRQFDVHRVGSTDCLTMELLEGETLRTQMERRKRDSKPYTPNEVKTLLKPLCDALDYAHTETVHRDIKPENVWISKNGTVKLMDFGIAKAMSASQLTQTGTAMGTAYYMAPEQLKSAGQVDGRADQYAVAVLTYELLSGDVPAGAIKPLYQQAKGVPRAFSDAVMKALSPNPEQRYPDMASFASALGLGNTSGGVTLPWKTLGIAAAVLVVVGLGGFALSQTDFKSLLPLSAEEKQAQYNAAVQLEGEVKDLAQKLDQRKQAAQQQLKDLEQRQRGMEQSLRTAREGKEELRQELDTIEEERQWAEAGWALRQRAVFESARLNELKGQLTLGSRQVQDKLYAEARLTLERTKPGYQQLLEQDQAGEDIPPAKQQVVQSMNAFAARTEGYGLSEPAVIAEARTRASDAQRAESVGELQAARELYRAAAQGWQQGLREAAPQIARIDGERAEEQARAAAKAKAEAEARARAQAEAKAKAEAAARARAEEEAKAKKAQAEAEAKAACARNPACMEDLGNGVLKQVSTGLQWTQSDNGRDIDWSSAMSWCSGKGGGWQLPTAAELQSLYDRSYKSISCGGSTCEVSPLFRLTSYWFWSSERNGSSEAWIVFLTIGSRFSHAVSYSSSQRALCVRRS